MIINIFFCKRTPISLLLMLLVIAAWAGPVSQSEAYRIAQNFLQSRGTSTTRSAGMALALEGQSHKTRSLASDYYVFNVDHDGGFVIVSGDDNTPAILGYADKGHIDQDAMPDGLRYLLEGYAEQIAWLETHEQVARAATRSEVRTPISPLVETRWNQTSPYYNNCPQVGDEHTVTGCVATSMAQLMYYHQYPTDATNAIPGYTSKTLKIELAGLSTMTFEWDAMTHTYNNNSTSAATEAVAKLMQYCGWALQMDYNVNSAGGSSSYNACVPDVLKTYFGYDSGVRSARRNSYSYQEWVALIYEELANRRPVILGGQSAGGGHSFVCDGYDTDDYFHINWGWGGSSDGFYRLSALNPYEQGAGGSSSMDGFSFSQDAIIGIQKPTGSSSPGYCLSLEGFCFGVPDADQSKPGHPDTSNLKVFSRDNSGKFSDIPFYMTLCSYKFGTNDYDVALELTDGSGNAVYTLPVLSSSFTFNTNNYGLFPFAIPANVFDGTYYIKAVSRPNGSTTWQECYDNAQYQMTAIISGNNLTISVPLPGVSLPSFVSLIVNGNKTVGHEQEVMASVKGGVSDYHQNLFLYVGGKRVAGKQVDIPAGQTVDVRFLYTPSSAGDNQLDVYANGTKIGSGSETIVASDATDNLNLSFAAIINNTTGGQLYGNAFRASVTATNASTENSYAGKLNCSVRKWMVTQNGDEVTVGFESLGVISQPLVVSKNGQTTLDFAYDGLEKDAFYSFRFTYIKNGVVTDAIHLGLGKYQDSDIDIGTITVTDGYRLGDATGATTIFPPSNTINAGTASFADLRGLSSLDGVTITPSSNPNCLYLIASEATMPDGLTNCNVIKGNTAEAITLVDGNDFYSPINFTAQNISYTRTFTLAADGTAGWNSLMVPFAVSNISCAEIGLVDWFHSASDTGKNFWLRSFAADASGTVTFDYATTLAANTPYIIAVPDNRWGEDRRMTNRAVTFSATNAPVSATKETYVSGDYYKFCGTTATKALTNVYKLNTTGSKFVKQASTSAGAFRVWFSPVSITSLTLSSLSIDGPGTTGLSPISVDVNETQADGWYSLDGRRLSGKPTAKGIYIFNGKKQIIR